MRWSTAKQLSDVQFKRLLGVQRSTFLDMIGVIKQTAPVSTHKHIGKKRGPKSKLNTYDKLLMLLMYYREYRTYAHIASSYNISEAQCWRIVTDLEKRLLTSNLFHLPGKKTLLRSDIEWEAVVIDASEHSIERPKKSNVSTILARKRNTL
jgi:hypothetical protein